jgi:catechol 2,3-dioxygenase-like lactoylglutathione lyase family enzyme
MVAVYVNDQEAALRFWTEQVGFELRTDERYGEEHRWIEVAPPGAETVLALVRPQHPDHPEPGWRTGISFDTPDVEVAHATLSERGVDVDEIMRMGDPVPPLASFRDLDGNEFMFAQRD